LGADGEDRLPHAFALAAGDAARLRRPSPVQWFVLILAAGTVGLGLWRAPGLTAGLAIIAVQVAFAVCAAWRILLVLTSLRPTPAGVTPAELPTYSILVALHDEAEVAPQLVAALSAIDYPPDRLEGFLLLEAHDQTTLSALEAVDRPAWLRILIVPPGAPTTKPRALNHGLSRCRAELVTVYDAEDRPDPLQLREAAARFAADHDGRLACVQAPLRVVRLGRTRSPFLDRQFALEYAALFEVTLPGLARLGMPFPLGGTSNHFRAEALRAVGGWDAWNVTEDADLGFRLHRHGWRLDVISRATLETPPGDLHDWLPQRTRWMKGFMQTWGVHTRRPWTLGLKGGISLLMTLGMALASAAAHAPSVAWVAASVLAAAAMGLTPATPPTALFVLGSGVVCAWLTAGIGARRAGIRYGPVAMAESPAYWSLLSIAFAHAAWRLVTEPFAWDKTRHSPDVAADAGPGGLARPISGA
jgi:cellulose synthase/poly-beta-1,6-N-acetylglucosamine synthase-like glycosyltransferase